MITSGVSLSPLSPKAEQIIPPRIGPKKPPIPKAELYMPEALSERMGEFLMPFFSYTASIISGMKGTKIKESENPIPPNPTKLSDSVWGKPSK